MKTPKKIERVREFDGIRGLAALSVILFHLTNQPSYQFNHSSLLFPFSFEIGAYGVDIFFMLSGFVIFMSLERQSSILKFYRSRFIRLFPIFWFCVISSTLAVIAFHINISTKISIPIVLANLTMIPRQFMGVSSPIEGSYWTLEYELFFYILISIVYFKFDRKYIIYIFIFLSFLSAIVNYYDLIRHTAELPRLTQSLVMRLYGLLNVKYANLFLAGISLYLYRDTKRKFYCFTFIFAILCSFSYTNGIVVSAIALVFWFSNVPAIKSIFCSKILVFFGEISYPLYLIHCNLGRYLITQVSNLTYSTSLGLIGGFTCIIALSILLTFKVDIPVRKYLHQSFQ